ncbi:hypothetical protein PCI56_18930 [Plesiomonas shigelloides subsp. oncorhynchi]|nr:hypothetical protein [Plesiomonas shigelloides]
MFHLYPPIQPYYSGFIRRGQHQIYLEQVGNPQGLPVLFVHGGPGRGAMRPAGAFSIRSAFGSFCLISAVVVDHCRMGSGTIIRSVIS